MGNILKLGNVLRMHKDFIIHHIFLFAVKVCIKKQKAIFGDMQIKKDLYIEIENLKVGGNE